MPIHLCLLAAAAALAADPAADPAALSHGEVGFTLTSGGFRKAPSYGGWRVDAEATGTLYLRGPLSDDDTPLSLQPYLQRASSLRLTLSGGALAGDDSATTLTHDGRGLGGTLSTLFHLGGFVVGAALFYERYTSIDTVPAGTPPPVSSTNHDQWHTYDTQLVRPALTLGLRFWALQLDLTYRFRLYLDSGSPRAPQWGQALFRLQHVVRRIAYLSLEAYTLEGGGGVDAGVEVYPTQRAGVWLSGWFQRGEIYVNSQFRYDDYGGRAGASFWVARRVKLFVEGRVGGVSDSGNVLIDGRASAGVLVRLP